MKVVTLYSPSHKEMYENFFLPSLPKDDRIELKVIEVPQLAGEKPEFNSPEWKQFMYLKADTLYNELISTPEDDFYLFLDVDIIIVNNFVDFISQEMENHDMVCQSDSCNPVVHDYCTGVIAIRNNWASRLALETANKLYKGTAFLKNEQEALTYTLDNSFLFEGLENFRYKTLDFANAFTYGSFGRHWHGQDFELPPKENLYFVHANYTDYENKINLLKKFQEKLI